MVTPVRFGMPINRWVRWRFDYANYKPTKYGLWCQSGDMEHQAWCTNKDMLLRATIEQKDMRTQLTTDVVSCAGQDFVNFRWQKIDIWNGQVGTLPGCIVGLIMVTRDWEYRALVDGKTQKRRRAESDKTVHWSGFGR